MPGDQENWALNKKNKAAAEAQGSSRSQYWETASDPENELQKIRVTKLGADRGPCLCMASILQDHNHLSTNDIDSMFALGSKSLAHRFRNQHVLLPVKAIRFRLFCEHCARGHSGCRSARTFVSAAMIWVKGVLLTPSIVSWPTTLEGAPSRDTDHLPYLVFSFDECDRENCEYAQNYRSKRASMIQHEVKNLHKRRNNLRVGEPSY